MNKPRLHLFLTCFTLLLTLAVLQGCRTVADVTATDISGMYAAQERSIVGLNELLNISENRSSIALTIFTGGLEAFSSQSGQELKLAIAIYRKTNKTELHCDTIMMIPDSSVNEDQKVLAKWIFNAPVGYEYMIKATCPASAGNQAETSVFWLDKRDDRSAQWYNWLNEDGNQVVDRVAFPEQKLLLQSPMIREGKLQVKYFGTKFGLPLPPFTTGERAKFDYKSDSSFTLDATDGSSGVFSLLHKGLYLFGDEQQSSAGPGLVVLRKGYPLISSSAQMLECLRYITSAKEFQQLSNHDSPKLAVDSFWIANTGTLELATEMIRRYYVRAEYANRFFTSFTEGWQTDRGMIYIIFGKPAHVYRSFEKEVWVYGENSSPSALRFYFTKVGNPFTDNDYILERREYYKSVWYQHVQAWRR